MISIDEFKSAPSGGFSAQQRMTFASFGFYEGAAVQTVAPIVYDHLGHYTDLLQIFGVDGPGD